jgi:hypothetical protein
MKHEVKSSKPSKFVSPTQAFEQGRVACRLHKSPSAVPYRERYAAEEWERGWRFENDLKIQREKGVCQTYTLGGSQQPN